MSFKKGDLVVTQHETPGFGGLIGLIVEQKSHNYEIYRVKFLTPDPLGREYSSCFKSQIRLLSDDEDR